MGDEKEVEIKVNSAYKMQRENHPGDEPQNLITKAEFRQRGDGKSLREILRQPPEEEKYVVKPLLSLEDKGFVPVTHSVGLRLSPLRRMLGFSAIRNPARVFL